MATDPRDPDLTWTPAGAPRSGRFDDVYFSADDGLAESRAVFLGGCGLPEAWVGRSHFTVAELGFGTGLNIAALLDLWARARPPGGRLTVFSTEAYPLSRDQAARALAAWPELSGVTQILLDRWPGSAPGLHRVDLPEFGAVLDLAIGDVDGTLGQWLGQADAWFLDGFAPAVNPAMWSGAVLDAVARGSRPGARVATFTVAGAVRRGLAERGFTVDKRPGHGRKRERLEARAASGPAVDGPALSVGVIGAGIAGAAVVRALAAQGVRATVIEAEGQGAGASCFPAALVTPRFDLGDAAVAALFAQALRRARLLYARTPGAVLAEGVIQWPKDPTEVARLERVARQDHWDSGAMEMIGGALRMREALTVSPAAILSAWLESAERLAGRAAGFSRVDGRWRVLDAAGAILGTFDRLVVCAGPEAVDLIEGLALAPVRGQADWVAAEPAPAMAWGGYVAPTADGFLFGATHDRGRRDTAVNAEDTHRNLATLAARLPALAERVDPTACRSRAAIRATTRDRLPLAGSVEGREGLFVLGGLGSRGFCLAPLLAEHVVAAALDRPSPLPRAIATRVDPGRAAAGVPPQPEASLNASQSTL